MSAAPQRKKIRLGDLLVEQQVISEEQLMSALKEQKKTGSKLGRALIDLGYINEQAMLEVLSRQLSIPLIDLRHYQFRPDIVRLLPETYARRFRSIVLDNEGEGYLVGMADPTDLYAFDELSRILKKSIKQAVVQETELLLTFDTVYRRTDEISSLAQELGQELEQADFDVDQLLVGDDVVDAPVVKLLQSLFEDAVQVRASDIHIEPDETVLRIRQRIDGVLHEQITKEKRIASAVVLRLKLMAGLDISEKRLPQDGRFNIKVKGAAVDVRMSTMPIQYGESVVMRLLNQSGNTLNLENLGMPEDILQRFRRVLRHPSGIVLVTGPTGSGKTTTLYSALHELNIPDKKIITVEDPVEYRLSRVNQVQINTKIGLGFAQILRTALRQDPDIVLIGEMRDQETAEIGLRAAMTGHLVLSTLHTNDAISTADRLLDMGAPGYLLAASLRAIIAQRLIRRICESCVEPYTAQPQERVWLGAVMGAEGETFALSHGRGCAHCNNTGYHGRVGVYEYLEPSADMLKALRQNDLDGFVQGLKDARYFRSLMQGAVHYMKTQITTVEEVMRVAGELDSMDHKPTTAVHALPALQV